MRALIGDLREGLRDKHAAEGCDPAAMMAGLRDAPEGPAPLQRFVRIARGAG